VFDDPYGQAVAAGYSGGNAAASGAPAARRAEALPASASEIRTLLETAGSQS
jgi:hypothetical protein